jgi:hypothetical protein
LKGASRADGVPEEEACVAYRQLCAVAFVMFGLVGVACGGDTTGSAAQPGPGDGAPPSADDAPPSSSDEAPPSSDDAPPSSADTPPGSADSPGGNGGRIQQLCEDACRVLEQISQCPGNELDPMTRQACDSGACAMAIDPAVPIPCLDQIESLFDCFTRLPNVCMPTEQQAQQCVAELESFSQCAEQQEPPVIDEPPQGPICDATAECQRCPDDCSECLCDNADLGADALTFCSDVCPTTAN